VLTQSNTSKNKGSSKNKINKSDIPANRGLELVLNSGKRKQKPFHIIFDKMIHFFNTEIDIHFEFSLNIRKKK